MALANVGIAAIIGVSFGVVVYVAYLVLAPIILNSTNTVQSNAYIGNYSGVSDLFGLGPLIFAVGGLIAAGLPVFLLIRQSTKFGGEE